MGSKQPASNPASHVEILREATRDANAAVKDLRQAQKDVEAASKEAQAALAAMMRESIKEMHDHAEALITEQTRVQVMGIAPSVQAAVKRVEEKITRQFNEITDMMLNGPEGAPGLLAAAKMVNGLASATPVASADRRRERLSAVGIDEAVARRMLGEEAVNA